MKNGFECEIRLQGVDPEWDTFVASAPGGDHTQSSVWGVVKSFRGWSPIRMVVKKAGCIVGGAQILLRQFPFSLRIGYVPQGPVLREYQPEVVKEVMGHLSRVIRSSKIQYITLHPPRDCGLLDELSTWGFQLSRTPGDRYASIVLDLSQQNEILLGQMRRTTRNNIRLANEKGVRIRKGGDDDVGLFYRFLKATNKRHKSTPESEDYIQNLWRQLNPHKHVQLFIAEYDNQALSALLTISFGCTVVAKRFGWSGNMKWLHVNELLFWKAIEWSKENGFQAFDFDGIEISAALALLEGKSLPPSVMSTPTRFKAGFGGSVVIYPPTYEFVSNRFLRLLLEKSYSMPGAASLRSFGRRMIHA